MDHLTLKAVTTTTDQGVFEAVISTETVDREKDIVSAPGLVDALRKWNRPIPLSWNHGVTAEDIFGNVDSQTARTVAGEVAEVAVEGQVDLDSKVGAEAWRSFKSRSVGFSFGYLILASTKRKGGGRHITALDVFEITATPTPMNNDTRVLSTKGVEELREEAKRVERQAEEDQIPAVAPAPPVEAEPTVDVAQELQEVKAQLAETRQTLDDLKNRPDPAQLRKQAAQVQREAEQEQIPDVPEQPQAPAEPEIDLKQELQEVKTQLAEMRASFEDLKKKAEVTDKEPRARSVDPLRQQAEAVALEEASGGESLRKPPRKVTQKPPELVPLRELRQRTRDEMLARLSEGIPE